MKCSSLRTQCSVAVLVIIIVVVSARWCGVRARPAPNLRHAHLQIRCTRPARVGGCISKRRSSWYIHEYKYTASPARTLISTRRLQSRLPVQKLPGRISLPISSKALPRCTTLSFFVLSHPAGLNVSLSRSRRELLCLCLGLCARLNLSLLIGAPCTEMADGFGGCQ